MNHHHIAVLPKSNIPLPPPERRTLAERVRAANVHWSNLLLDINSSKSPMRGALVWFALKNVMADLIHDEALCLRIEQYFETMLRAEGPKPTEKLI